MDLSGGAVVSGSLELTRDVMPVSGDDGVELGVEPLLIGVHQIEETIIDRVLGLLNDHGSRPAQALVSWRFFSSRCSMTS